MNLQPYPNSRSFFRILFLRACAQCPKCPTPEIQLPQGLTPNRRVRGALRAAFIDPRGNETSGGVAEVGYSHDSQKISHIPTTLLEGLGLGVLGERINEARRSRSSEYRRWSGKSSPSSSSSSSPLTWIQGATCEVGLAEKASRGISLVTFRDVAETAGVHDHDSPKP